MLGMARCVRRVFAVVCLAALVIPTLGGAAVHAQPSSDEAILSQRVQEAEARVQSLQSRLAEARRTGDPVLARYAELNTQRDALTDRINTLFDRVDQADAQVQRLPITLTARRDALTDILIRMYNQGADAEDIAERERQLADVNRQIEALEAENAPRRAATVAARRDLDRVRAQRDAIDRQLQDMEFAVAEARGSIEGLSRQLADAQTELNRIREMARWELNENGPPYLSRVEVVSRRETIYQAEWEDAARETEEMLRLAQYLHADLTRSIELRQRRIDEWISEVEGDQEAFNRAMAAYTRLIGGSSDGIMGYVERGLDYISGGWAGALVSGGTLTWRKIGVELGDAALTVFRDTRSGAPVYAALGIEAISQVSDVLWREGAKNPSWDVTRNPSINGAIRSNQANISGLAEREMINSINAGGIRSALERMRGQLSSQLESENYRDALVSAYGDANLATALTRATFTAELPPLNFDDRNLIGRDPAEWAWGFVSTPSGAMKTLIKEAMFGDATNFSNGRALFLDAVQSAVRDGLLEQLERERIEAWDRVLRAELDVALSVSNLRNQGRIRRMEQRIQTLLADEIIPQLTREVESLRSQRTLNVTRNRAAGGRTAEIRLTFSAPVVIDSIQLGDEVLEASGAGTSWTASFRPGDFEEMSAILAVDAHHAALAERRLDNPQTKASWSSLDRRFNAYEMEVDQHHAITIDPPSGTAFAIVLDTSGSMVEDGSTRLAQAQAALANLFASGRIQSGDEVALFTFAGCSVSTAVPFTEELELAANAVAGASAGGSTPLAASIDTASAALTAQNVEHGVLVVVTDGEDSCDGNVAEALRVARERVDAIRSRTVR